MGINIMPVSDLRRRTSDVISTVRDSGNAVYITQYGRPVVVLVDYEYYEQLIAQLKELSGRTGLKASPAEQSRPHPTHRYPTVENPASSLSDWLNLLPEGYDGDALADTEALYDEV